MVKINYTTWLQQIQCCKRDKVPTRDWPCGSAWLSDADIQISASKRLTCILLSERLLKIPSHHLVKLISQQNSKGKGYLIKGLIILISHDISSLFQHIIERNDGYKEAIRSAPQAGNPYMGLTWNGASQMAPW